MELTYINEKHRAFYEEHTTNGGDIYRDCLWYLLGVAEDTREHWREIYDTEERAIIPECLRAGWQTSSSGALVRLAFDLYHGDPVVLSGAEDLNGQVEELTAYSVSGVFGRLHEYLPYAIQAIAMRYNH